jgi:hypothetical protein
LIPNDGIRASREDTREALELKRDPVDVKAFGIQ